MSPPATITQTDRPVTLLAAEPNASNQPVSNLRARRLALFAWFPALCWTGALLILLPRLPLPPASAPAAPWNTNLDLVSTTTVFFLNLFLLSGNALALTWFMTLHAFVRSRTGDPQNRRARFQPGHPGRNGNVVWAPPGPTGSGLSPGGMDHAGVGLCAAELIRAGAITVGAGSLATLVLAMLVGGEPTLALTLCIYAPSLLVAYGLLGLASARMAAWWKVLLSGTGLWVTMLVAQLLYLDPSGKPPSDAVFALASLPIVVAVGVWLVAWSADPRPSPAGVAR